MALGRWQCSSRYGVEGWGRTGRIVPIGGTARHPVMPSATTQGCVSCTATHVNTPVRTSDSMRQPAEAVASGRCGPLRLRLQGGPMNFGVLEFVSHTNEGQAQRGTPAGRRTSEKLMAQRWLPSPAICEQVEGLPRLLREWREWYWSSIHTGSTSASFQSWACGQSRHIKSTPSFSSGWRICVKYASRIRESVGSKWTGWSRSTHVLRRDDHHWLSR